MINFRREFIKAVISGIYIMIAVAMYLVTVNLPGNNEIVSSFLFCIAIVLIIARDYNLYTGKVGYLYPFTLKQLKIVGITMLGNIVGLVLTGLLLNLSNIPNLTIYANEIVVSKYEMKSAFEVFLLSIFCGTLMFTAIDGYRNIKDGGLRIITIILSIVVFILIGFEHSVANIGYVVLSKTFNMKIVLYFFIAALGNLIGAVLMNVLNIFANTKEDKTEVIKEN